ncbi:hypothetical protein Tco_0123713 [Tanacetum coccineum]
MSDISVSSLIHFTNFFGTLPPFSNVPIVLPKRVKKFILNMKSALVVPNICKAIARGVGFPRWLYCASHSAMKRSLSASSSSAILLASISAFFFLNISLIFKRGPVREEGDGGSRGGARGSRGREGAAGSIGGASGPRGGARVLKGVVGGSRGGSSVSGGASGSTGRGAC